MNLTDSDINFVIRLLTLCRNNAIAMISLPKEEKYHWLIKSEELRGGEKANVDNHSEEEFNKQFDKMKGEYEELIVKFQKMLDKP